MLRRMRTRSLVLCAVLFASGSATTLACSSTDPGVPEIDAGGHDASADSGHAPSPGDAGHTTLDAGHPVEVDAGTPQDGGHHNDGGHDGGHHADAGTADGGLDASHDAANDG